MAHGACGSGQTVAQHGSFLVILAQQRPIQGGLKAGGRVVRQLLQDFGAQFAQCDQFARGVLLAVFDSIAQLLDLRDGGVDDAQRNFL